MPSQSLFVLCLDSYGALTLRQPLFESLLDAGNRVGVAVRTPHDRLLPFLDKRLESLATSLDPRQATETGFWTRAAQLHERISAFAPDLLVCAPHDRTLLDQWLLRRSRAPTLGLSSSPTSDAELDAGLPGATRHATSALTIPVPISPDASEVDRNRALLEAVSGANVTHYQPRIQVPEREQAVARQALERLGLEAGRYALGAPAGTANVALKAWPPGAFLDLAAHLERRHGLATLVTGVESEARALEGLCEAGVERGLHLRRWIGSPDDLGELLGLIRLSRLYAGSDAGPMHFAAALDTPVLALFGGGHWPRFLPSARRFFAATRRLPCFGCGWDCWLPEPACITTVDTEALLAGADWLLAEDAPGRRVDTGAALDEETEGLVREGATLYRRTCRALKIQTTTGRRRLEASLRRSEIEGARHLRTMAHQEGLIGTLSGQVGRLSTPRAALRVLTAAALRKAGLFELARRGLERTKARERQPGPARADPQASTPLLDALALARSLPGGTPEPDLERSYQLGSTLSSVLCLHGTPRNLQTAVMLACGGARVSWLGDASALRGLSVPRLDAPAPDLGSLLASSPRPTLASGTALLLDADGDEESLRLLAWRLARDTTLLVNGGSSGEGRWASGLLPPPAEGVGSLSIHRSPPAAWQDPAGSTLPERLPSGRPWPRITVVTVTLNQARFLEQTLLSVLSQGYPDLEYIVRDGGSTDGTREILERYRARLAHCIIERDEGQSDALNKGFALSSGQILAWLNSDDRYPAGSLCRAAVAFDAFRTDMVAGGCRLVRGNGDETGDVHHCALPVGRVVPLPLDRILDLEGSWLKGDFFYQPEVFWTREIWERSGGGVAKELFYGMDYELWARMAREGARVVHVPDVLAIYRMHGDQKTSGLHLPYLPELRRVAGGLRRRWSIP